MIFSLSWKLTNTSEKMLRILQKQLDGYGEMVGWLGDERFFNLAILYGSKEWSLGSEETKFTHICIQKNNCTCSILPNSWHCPVFSTKKATSKEIPQSSTHQESSLRMGLEVISILTLNVLNKTMKKHFPLRYPKKKNNSNFPLNSQFFLPTMDSLGSNPWPKAQR